MRATETDDNEDVTTLTRRNSTVELWNRKGLVRKHYHSNYCVAEEARALSKLVQLTDAMPGLGTPQVLRVLPDENTIELEFIEGRLLADVIRQSGPSVLSPFRSRLILFLSEAYREDYACDLDPSNIIISDNTNNLVIVDPICTRFESKNFTACVFLFGLIKTFIISFRYWEYLSFAQEWQALANGYLSSTEQTKAKLYADIGDYIDLVISWNSAETRAEGRVKKIFRSVVIIPVWYAIRLLFKRLSR